ncbi:ImmA/IrrE family metallo-endopeptidase [Acetobacter thailandicus]|uniref:ImmA/IrrE family metallo-endopeptidase n=1 Tax=Acetobacter thailandicus TaxID=1502842 RepID=UPI001BAE1D87|nr:ImmA/IrrE family metallo-endopeptidase [Acetobacter thailandicus]MBS0986617.1 ImmA/IrrE family metallo-endopeptidase [Acetobacter thailandicus]
MTGYSFVVPPLRWSIIERNALHWRDVLGLEKEPYFPVMEVIEKILCNKMDLFTLTIVEQKEMGRAEGYTSPTGEAIYLREDVYRGACNGVPRDRFTAAHELGHWDMHTNLQLARVQPEENIPAYRQSEPQANQFASELLMPASFFSVDDTPDTVMQRHGVSHYAASNRLSYLQRKGRLHPQKNKGLRISSQTPIFPAGQRARW